MSINENRRIKMTKTLLKTSLIELMHTKPLGKITIRELCDNADVNRSTFYLYYSDQISLLEDIEAELLSHVREHLEKLESDYGTLPYLESMLKYIEDNAEMFRTLLCCQDSVRFQTAFVSLTMNSLAKNLQIRCDEPRLSYVYEYLLMGNLSVIKKWIESDFNISTQDMAKLIFQLSDQAISNL
jgi:AcrR family transcriptional regulator